MVAVEAAVVGGPIGLCLRGVGRRDGESGNQGKEREVAKTIKGHFGDGERGARLDKNTWRRYVLYPSRFLGRDSPCDGCWGWRLIRVFVQTLLQCASEALFQQVDLARSDMVVV